MLLVTYHLLIMRSSILLAVAAGTLSALGSPINARSPYAVKGSHPVPNGWTQMYRAAGDQLMELRIGLKQGNFKELEKQLFQGKCPPVDHLNVL